MLAECCDFGKQSPGPIHCAPHGVWGPLLPKLRGEIAKFLNEGSLARLSALTLGHLCRFAVRAIMFQRLEAFLGTVAFPTSLPRKLPIRLRHVTGRFSDPIALERTNQHSHSLALDSVMRPSITPRHRCRNLDLLSIGCAVRPHLRSRLSLGGRPFPRNPCPYGEEDSHFFYRYSCRHPHFYALHHSFRYGFSACRTLPYQRNLQSKFQSAASVIDLSPDHFRRIVTRPVSYYALFKWWLLLSQHPGCFGNSTSFAT